MMFVSVFFSPGTRAALACAVLCALWAAGAGCGSDAEPDGGGGADAGGTGGAGGGASAVPCEEPPEVDLGGTWAAFARLSVSLRGQVGGAVTVCPVDQVRESSLLLLLSMDQTQLEIPALTAVACWFELPNVTGMAGECDPTATNLVTTQILQPPALIAALPDIQAPIGRATLSSRLAGADFRPDRFTFLLGTTRGGDQMPSWLDNQPGCGALDLAAGRTSACETGCVDDCGALVDDDRDGWVGVTMHVCGVTADDTSTQAQCNAENPSSGGVTLQGRALMGFELAPRLDGTVTSSCEVSGQVDANVRYQIIGSDIYLANTQIGVSSVIKSLPSMVVDASQSRFRMIRVDGKYGAPSWGIDLNSASGTACDLAIQNMNQLL